MKSAFLLSLSAAALAASGALADEIRVLNWQGYGTDLDWSLKAFEEATGNTVVHEYFNSEQEMLTKLRTNPGAYDVVLVNAIYNPQATEEGLLAPVDTSALENYAGIPAEFAQSDLVTEGGEVYGVPWTWGVTSFAVNTQVFDPAPGTLEVLWDPAHAGRVSIRDDAVEAMQIGALATGQGINDIQDLDAVQAKLEALMPQVRTFWGSENDWNQFMAAGEFDVATYWSGSAARSAAMGLPVEFVVPKEGAIGWLDSLAIPATSEHKEAAAQFIDWMIDPEFYVKWDAEGAPASANAEAAAALDETAFNRRVLGDPEVAARVQFQTPVDDGTRQKYLEIWQALKAAQ
ncbi:PotD/PotF family extracellular solute-binding protein [Mangrovicoccus sp. HB161399]|uniref:ABC transporter substrate-binding protein n=1 Tax=Mangrovicoccus sp. HB161399 TaxID=2720392 RepID=UPI00155760E8|nr:extracellular solute-binding protein [Mangrovicoccus sp. HB161399]